MVTETYVWSDKEVELLASLLLQQHKKKKTPSAAAAAAATAATATATAASVAAAEGSTAAAAAAAAAAGLLRLQRFKGLGEMQAEQLRATTMNAETRILKQIQLRDAQQVVLLLLFYYFIIILLLLLFIYLLCSLCLSLSLCLLWFVRLFLSMNV